MCNPVAFQPDHVKFAPRQSKWRYAPSPQSSYWTANKPRWDHRKAATQMRYNSFSRDTAARKDPPSQPKLAVPLTVPRYIFQNGALSTCPRTKVVGDLALIAFYYLLRVGEYTYHRLSDRRRTQHFRLHNVAF